MNYLKLYRLIKKGYKLSRKKELAILRLYEKKRSLLSYILNWKVFRKKLLFNYVKHHRLRQEAELKLFEIPVKEQREVLLFYFKYRKLHDESELKLFDLVEEGNQKNS